MIKADFHIHSTVSDGSYTIGQIIGKAISKGLDAIAITDHDTLSHASQIPPSLPIKVIAGTEISAFDYDKSFRVHILGYNIKRPEILEEFVRPTREARHNNSLKQIEILNSNGYDIDVDKVPKADGKYIYKQHIMDYLVEHGMCDELFGDFYYKTFKNNGICCFDICYPNPADAVKAVKSSGGIAVIAHSGQQENFCLIPELVKQGLDGLELNHHSNSAAHMKIIREYAQRYNLVLTGGSDCHGIYEAGSPDVGDYISEESGVELICGKIPVIDG